MSINLTRGKLPVKFIVTVPEKQLKPIIVISVENLSIILTILVSCSALITGIIKTISSFTIIKNEIETLNNKLEITTKTLEELNEEIVEIDKKIEVQQVILNQLTEKK